MTPPLGVRCSTVRSLALGAMLVLAFAASPAAAQVTSLTMQSEPGDYVGAGRTYAFTPAEGMFYAYRNSAGGVSVSFDTWSWSTWWSLEFAAPDGAPLTPGVYAGVMRFPFQDPGRPGLAVYGEGRACNTLTGGFEVKEIQYGTWDEILAFRATFEQHCEGAGPALVGEVRFNASVPLVVHAPATVSVAEGEPLSFTVSVWEELARAVALSATGLPPGASFVDNGDNTGTFSWTPTPGSASAYRVAFHGDNGLGVDTASTLVTVIPASPPNDERAGAVVVPRVPFTHVQDTSTATSSAQDPHCFGSDHSVWFAFTPAQDRAFEANTFGSVYDTTLGVYAAGPNGLTQLACNDDSGGPQSRVRFNAVAGTTYYFVVSSFPGFPGGPLTFNVFGAPPALAVTVALLRSGAVDPTSGAATVNGLLLCSRPVYVSVTGQLTQDRAGAAPTGFFSTSLICDGSTPWSATVQTAPALFRGRAVALFKGGPAKASANAWAYDFDSGESTGSTAAASILLRGGGR